METLQKTEIKAKNTEILEQQQKKAETQIKTIKTFLNDINYKTIEQLYHEYINNDKKTKEIDKKVNE